jgi:hypothetical protein
MENDFSHVQVKTLQSSICMAAFFALISNFFSVRLVLVRTYSIDEKCLNFCQCMQPRYKCSTVHNGAGRWLDLNLIAHSNSNSLMLEKRYLCSVCAPIQSTKVERGWNRGWWGRRGGGGVRLPIDLLVSKKLCMPTGKQVKLRKSKFYVNGKWSI